jgi:hypothetical protein
MGASFLGDGVLGATTNTNAHKHCFEAGLRIETAVSPQGDPPIYPPEIHITPWCCVYMVVMCGQVSAELTRLARSC